MEENLNAAEDRLFDLVTSRSWEELTEEEQLFAAAHITPAEYSLQRELLLAASEELYPDDGYEPLPLAFPPAEKARPFFQRSIPLYQALSAVAAVILFFMLLRPGNNAADATVLPGKSAPATASAVQAVAQEHVYDTMVRYVTVVKESQKTIIDTIRKAVAFPQAEEQPRLLQAAAALPVPALTSEKLETRGASLKEENTARLVPKVVNTIY